MKGKNAFCINVLVCLLTTVMFLMTQVTCPATAYAQKKKGTKQQATQRFEGALLYRNYEHHSKVIRKFSLGQAYNGERTVKVVVKDNAIHINDESMHMHTIVKPSENKVYIYNDVSNEGLTARAADYLQKYLSVYDPNVSIENIKKTSTLKSTGRSVEYKGDNCKTYEGQLTSGGNMQTDVEMWYSDKLSANSSYKYLFWGLPLNGIVRKGIISQSGSIPLMGKVKSTIATELVAMKKYRVSNAEMMPPSKVKMETLTSDKQLVQFYNNSTKALKKNNLYPKIKKQKDVDYEITQQWDFAENWLRKEFRSQDQSLTWTSVGEKLFETVNSYQKSTKSSGDENDDENKTTGNPQKDKAYKKYLSEYNSLRDAVRKLKSAPLTRTNNASHANMARAEYKDKIRSLQKKMRLAREKCLEETGLSITPSPLEN